MVNLKHRIVFELHPLLISLWIITLIIIIINLVDYYLSNNRFNLKHRILVK